jgi:hypothetical protein
MDNMPRLHRGYLGSIPSGSNRLFSIGVNTAPFRRANASSNLAKVSLISLTVRIPHCL